MGVFNVAKKKKKKSRKKQTFNPSALNTHHILWQARHWNVGYSRALRNNEYMKKLIPRDTLHKEIHCKIADVPVPSGELCKKAYLEIEKRLKEGTIDSKKDSIETRINLLLEVWDYDSCPRTVDALLKQRSIVTQFYYGRP